nr:Gag-Pol polyprotein [Tanacetum cinerariifolium]
MVTRWRSRVASRPSLPSGSSSPTTSTSKITTAPILPAPPTIVAPSTDIISLIVVPPRGFDRKKDGWTLTFLSLGIETLYGHTLPVTTIADSSTLSKFVYPPPHGTSRGALVSTHTDLLPPHKRFRDSYSSKDSLEEDNDADVLADIEADAGVDAGIEPVVTDDIVEPTSEDYPDLVSVDGSREVMQTGLKVAMHELYDHMHEIPVDKITDIKAGQRQLKAKSLIANGERDGLLDHVAALERSNTRLRDTLRMKSMRKWWGNRDRNDGEMEMEEAMGIIEVLRLSPKTETEMWNLTMKGNDLTIYTQRFQELTILCTKMVPEEEDQVKKFIGHKSGIGKARGKAYVLGGGEANLDSNVITGTFLLNNRYASMLFDSGADRSFVLTTLSALLDVIPSTLDVSYAVELANGRAAKTILCLEAIHDELSEKELKQIEADDQAIQTILFDLPEDIYATVDSYETAQEIWLRVQQMMKGSDIGIQEKKAKLFNEWERFTSNEGESIESYYHRFLKLMNDLKRNKHFPEKIASNLKFLNNLQPEWSRHVTIVHQTKDLHTPDYTQMYDFLKYNQKENYLQQPMPNPEDITDPTTAMNMALALMAKAFKLNYSTPTNNNQRISSNTGNRQIAQPGMNMGQDRQIQMVGGNGGNLFRQYAGNPAGYNDVTGNQNHIGNGNLMVVRAEGNAAGQNG